MPRRPGAQIIRRQRADRSTTYSLRVRVGGVDARVPLGNTNDGWDETRVERAREQLLAKIKLGLWTPPSTGPREDTADEEPTFRELASDWYHDRERNPAIRASTLKDDHWRLTRYLLPFFGERRPSEITPLTIKDYRRRIHEENAQISAARQAGEPMLDARNGLPLRPLGNESINKTLRTLGAVLDEGRRDKDNVRVRVLYPVIRQANQRRAEHGQPPILAHVTFHTLRRTYISFMLAAGFDLPYVQEQVGHQDPSTTLKIYAQVIRRPDRDRLRVEMQQLLGETSGKTTRERPEKAPRRTHEAKRPRPRSHEPHR